MENKMENISDIFWEIMLEEKIPNKMTFQELEKLMEFHDDKVLALSIIIKKWIHDYGKDKHDDNGLYADDDDIMWFCENIMLFGKTCYDMMLRTPFSKDCFYFFINGSDGDKLQDYSIPEYYMKEVPSHGHTYCYVLDKTIFKNDLLWDDIVLKYMSFHLQNRKNEISDSLNKE